MEARTRSAAESLARWATAGMLLVLLVAYRRLGALILSALPLASAAVAGLAAVSALFGSVHGITLAFGFTLLGVAQDYPLHLLSHRRPGVEPERVAAGLWPTLATGIASTCVAYLTFWFSGVTGLQQLACFTVTGLAVAGLTTRYAAAARHDAGAARLRPVARARAARASASSRLPRPLWAAAALVAVCAGAIALAPQPFWENDLSALTPVPADLLERDRALRAELGVADTRHLLVVEAATADAALEALEALDPELERAVAAGAIAAFDHAARYVPSRRRAAARASATAGRRDAARRARHCAAAHAVPPRRVRAVSRRRRARAHAAAADVGASPRRAGVRQPARRVARAARRVRRRARDAERRERRRGAWRRSRSARAPSRCSTSRRPRRRSSPSSASACS